MKILLLSDTLSLSAECLCISRHTVWRQVKSDLFSRGDSKADREITGRRGMTKESNETFLFLSQDCPRGGRQQRGSVESVTPKVKGNGWEWLTTLQNWSNHSRQGCHILSVQRLLILRDLLPVMFLKVFQNSTTVTLELVYVELSQSLSEENQNLSFL